MRLLAPLLLALLMGCHSPSSAMKADTLAPEWPEFKESTPAETNAPHWVEKALEDKPRPSLLETESSIFLSTYQQTLSRVDGPTCRFRPTCSGFAHRALTRHGVFGLILSFGRIQRAHIHDRRRYDSDGRHVIDRVDDHTFWFAPSGDPRWKWHEQVELNE